MPISKISSVSSAYQPQQIKWSHNPFAQAGTSIPEYKHPVVKDDVRANKLDILS